MSIEKDITKPIDSLRALRQEFHQSSYQRQVSDLKARLSELQELEKEVTDRLLDVQSRLSLTIRFIHNVLRKMGR